MRKFGITIASLFLFLPNTVFANPIVKSTNGIGYSVTEVDEESFVVNMPVPGFVKSNIQASMKGNVLTLSGIPNKEQNKTTYRGYKPTAFTKKFTLKKGTTVSKVTLTNGVLSIDLSLELPEGQKTIKINVN